MSMGDIIVLSVLGFMVGSIILGMINDKKSGKKSGCSGCANYGNCRAHLGCSNNTSKREIT